MFKQLKGISIKIRVANRDKSWNFAKLFTISWTQVDFTNVLRAAFTHTDPKSKALH